MKHLWNSCLFSLIFITLIIPLLKTTVKAESKIILSQLKVSSEAASPSDEGTISGDIFEKKKGNLHPFILASGWYTDNLFYANDSDDKESDHYTIISPGLWVAAPGSSTRLVDIRTQPTNIGGLYIDTRLPERVPDYQFYAMYRPEFEIYNDFSEENITNHHAEGLFQYNARGGFSLDVIDRYDKDYIGRGQGIPGEREKYQGNLFQITGRYPRRASADFWARLDYSNYLVKYDEKEIAEARDRMDNRIGGYLFYKLKPKTDMFLQYQYTDINYDDNILRDGDEHNAFLGVDWDVTAKTHGRVKAGYGLRTFNESGQDDQEMFQLEAEVAYNFSPKVTIELMALSGFRETDIPGTDSKRTYGLFFDYIHKFTEKVTGHLKVNWYRDDYNGEITVEDKTDDLMDDYFVVSPAVQYEFKRWLKAALGYLYETRESNFKNFDYDTNKVYLLLVSEF